ncbi:MAG: hypothetical protein LC135_16140 [Phycisphaerae bacterium]|nr:hypothetical protein [Phycisphaerae bacterium]MCZ2401370.1 hypothetical protein [Phycisphaerae bacterium]NUQ49126.1 hypothetical protein [Phycisphaerae bacterium]
MTQRFGRLCSVGFVLTFSAGALIALGCIGGFNGTSAFLGLPFPNIVGSEPNSGGSGGSGGGGGFFGGGSQGAVAPCEEALKRKFVTLTLRNQSRDDYIHYFMLLIAFVDTDTQSGAVCSDDIPIYTNFGYTQIPEGGFVEFGNFCVVGPALIYFHQGGRFREVGGELASAIGPAQGTSGTFDNRFGSNGLQVPVPNLIAFHNPGTTPESLNLRVSRPLPDPCFATDIGGGVSPPCQQDGFYYVDENDNFIGSSQLGTGSGRRVPSEFQGTGCQCLGFSQGYWTLAPSGTTAANAQCNQFLRGGRIEFVFIRDDRDPPIPQLVWRVTDDSGSLVHDFDARTGVR